MRFVVIAILSVGYILVILASGEGGTDMAGLIGYILGSFVPPALVAGIFASAKSRRTNKHFVWAMNVMLALLIVMKFASLVPTEG